MITWDAGNQVVIHLYARYELKILKDVRESGTWETNGYIVRSPAYQIWLNGNNKILSEETESASTNENWGLSDKVKLSPDQATDLFSFLIAQEKLLDHITNYDDQDAREALRKVYRLIAEYGRKIREGRQGEKIPEVSKKTIVPTALPKGSYFTVSQAAQVCGATSKQIRAWIRRGKLEGIELPGLGIIIKAGKLNEFLYQSNS